MGILINPPPFDLASAQEIKAFIAELEELRRERVHDEEDVRYIERHLARAREEFAVREYEAA